MSTPIQQSGSTNHRLKKQKPSSVSELYFALIGNVALITLLFLPFVKLSCRDEDFRDREVTVTGFELTVERIPEALSKMKSENESLHFLNYRYITLIAIPIIGVILALIAIGEVNRGKKPDLLVSLIGLGAFFTGVFRLLLYLELPELLKMEGQMLFGENIPLWEITWLFPFWCSFLCDAVIFLSSAIFFIEWSEQEKKSSS